MNQQSSNNNNNNAMYSENMDNGSSGLFDVQFDLQHALRILRKHKWPIVLFTALVTGLAAFYVTTVTPVYRSTSTLLIEQQKATGIGLDELYSIDTEQADYYTTQFEILKSRSLAERVVDRLDLWNNPELSSAARESEAKRQAAERSSRGEQSGVMGAVSSVKEMLGMDAKPTDTAVIIETENSVANVEVAESIMVNKDASSDRLDPAREQVVNRFLSRLTIAPVRRTKLVKISYESEDPVLAAEVANTVGDQYIVSYLEAKLEMTNRVSSWMGDQLGKAKATLDESEQRLIKYKQDNGLVDVGNSVARLNESELLLLTNELAQARFELASANDIYRTVRSLRNSPELLETVPGVQADPLVQREKIEQGQAQRQLDELLNRYGDRHPRVVDAKSQLSTLNRNLSGHIQRVVNSIEKDFQLKRQRVASIEAKLAEGKSEIQAIGTKKFELDALERVVVTNQGIYDTFFNRMSEARSAEGLEQANARISDVAIPSNSPVKPRKQLIVALAALASLLLSALMAFLYEQMDDTIKSTHDIENKLNETLLGILPLIKGGAFSKSSNLPLSPNEIPGTHNNFVEAINTVRTALCVNEDDNPRKVITITSSVPHEGKSTASMNLAYSLGQIERVLLIDCDMRRPTVASAIGIDKSSPGLSSLIMNTASAKDCIKRGAFGGVVDVLPAGPIPDQPLELLSSKRFEKILEQLRKHYDRIVIDSAPTQAVSDAFILSKLSDAMIYAVKSHDTSIELVKRGLSRLRDVNAPIAGLVITQVDIDKITSYGGDYYYQGYYDYYGYTEKGQRAKKSAKVTMTQEELKSIKVDDREVDLGFDYAPPTSTNGRSAYNAAAAATAVHSNNQFDNQFENPQFDKEFDLTAQIDTQMASANAAETTRVAKPRVEKQKDDLDII